MAQGCALLNMSSTIGWKWAQSDDAAWMVSKWMTEENDGKVFGLTKEQLTSMAADEEEGDAPECRE